MTANLTLTAQDRCDRCSAAARVAVRLQAGVLMFCGHHDRQYAEALVDSGAQVISNHAH